jgi:hypothetical protein
MRENYTVIIKKLTERCSENILFVHIPQIEEIIYGHMNKLKALAGFYLMGTLNADLAK